MSVRLLSAADLRKLLVTMLAGATNGDEERWGALLGKSIRVNIANSPKTNWRISPAPECRLPDRTAIVRAIDLVRAEHPYVRW